MKIVCVGCDLAGLSFANLMAAQGVHDIVIVEPAHDTPLLFSGVVLSGSALRHLRMASPALAADIAEHLIRWNSISVCAAGSCIRSAGHELYGIAYAQLMTILRGKCVAGGIHFARCNTTHAQTSLAEADVIVINDPRALKTPELYQQFAPTTRVGRDHHLQLETTLPLRELAFVFKQTDHGLFRAQLHPITNGKSAFVVECRMQTLVQAGLDEASVPDTLAYLEKVFRRELDGHELTVANTSWRQLPIVEVHRWTQDNVVLVGDAARTTHFSMGLGPTSAIDDAVVLRDALSRHPKVPGALALYERVRKRATIESQRWGSQCLQWLEDAEEHLTQPPATFAVNLLMRTEQLTLDSLQARDPALVELYQRSSTDAPHETATFH